MKTGSAVFIFTPDNTHYDIAKYAISRGMHIMIAKPAVQTVAEHQELLSILRSSNKPCLAMVDYHKRFDPIYIDAVMRLQHTDIMYFYSLMT